MTEGFVIVISESSILDNIFLLLALAVLFVCFVMGIVDKYSAQLAENKRLHKLVTSETFANAYQAADTALNNVPNIITEKFAKLEAKINKSKGQNMEPPAAVAAEDKSKIEVLEQKLKEEREKNGKLEAKVSLLTSQMEVLEAIVGRFQNVFKDFANHAADMCTDMNETVAILCDDDMVKEDNLGDSLLSLSDIEVGDSASTMAMGSALDLPGKRKDDTPPAFVLEAINNMTAEEYAEIEKMSMFDLIGNEEGIN